MHFTPTPLVRRRVLDGAYAAGAVLGAIGLFEIDIHAPRGFLDGIGYPAVVAIGSRFGRVGIMISVWTSSILILIGAFLVPDAGISITGEIANRAFGLVSVWIVALVLNQRYGLEQDIETGALNLSVHQRALLDTVNSVLLTELPLRDRIKRLTEFAAQLLNVDRVGVFRRRWDTNWMECMDLFRKTDRYHVVVADRADNLHPDYIEAMRRDLIVVADDVANAPQFEVRRSDFESNNVGAAMSAGIFLEGRMVGQITFSHLGAPRHWTTSEIVYARALGNVAALLFSAERNRESLAALDLMSEGIFTTGATGSVQYANRAAREIAARGREDSTESGLLASTFPQPAIPLNELSDKHEITFGNAELEIQRTRLPAGGTLTRINDVTMRNQIEREASRLQRKLNEAAKMEAIGQLAGGIAHDFNNLLSTIMGFSRFLEEDLPNSSKEHGYVKRILSACERGKLLIEQILDFAQAKPAKFNPVDLGEVIRQCEEQLRATLPSGIFLEVNAPLNFAWVAGNSVQLSQIVINLCNNARDALHSREGVVQLSLVRENPIVTVEPEIRENQSGVGEPSAGHEYACIRVADNGSGIREEDLPHIFEPFFTTKERYRGTGLGLSVVHGAVAAHHGLCKIRSNPDIGTTVSVYLPLLAHESDVAVQPAEMSLIGSERILLVDDEPDVLDAISIGLKRLGYQAEATGDPMDALRSLEQDGGAWDVLITDQIMPGLSGLELVARAKASRPDLVAILCSGLGEALDELITVRAGADAYIRKPVNTEDLARCIRRVRGARAVTQ